MSPPSSRGIMLVARTTSEPPTPTTRANDTDKKEHDDHFRHRTQASVLQSRRGNGAELQLPHRRLERQIFAADAYVDPGIRRHVHRGACCDEAVAPAGRGSWWREAVIRA